MPSYLDLGFDDLGIRTIPSTRRQTPSETRSLYQPGALSANRLYVGSEDDVVKADKEGLYVGDRDFADAPFSVDMDGNTKLTSAEITVLPTSGEQTAFKVMQADGSQLFEIDTTNGWVNIGPDQPTYNLDPQVALYVTKTVDGYHAVNIQNPSGGTLASCDIGCLNDTPSNVTSLSGLVDLGITSSNFADPDFAVYGANSCYLWSGTGEELYLGAANPTGSIHFFTGGLDSTDYLNVEINSDGVLIPKKTDTANEPPYVEGGLYYNTDEHKMYIGGETGWEELTSTVIPSPSISPSVSPSVSISPSVSPSTP